MKTILLFFFILLMATLRAVINREIKEVQIRNLDRFSCIDRSVPNKIEPQPTKTARIYLDKSGKLVIDEKKKL